MVFIQYKKVDFLNRLNASRCFYTFERNVKTKYKLEEKSKITTLLGAYNG